MVKELTRSGIESTFNREGKAAVVEAARHEQQNSTAERPTNMRYREGSGSFFEGRNIDKLN